MQSVPLTDTHAHLDYPDYDIDRAAVIERAKEAGIKQIITIAIGRKSIQRSLILCKNFSGIYAAVGVHPTSLDDLPLQEWPFLEEAARDPNVVAIGETGLDFHRLTPGNELEEKNRQKDYFLRQLELARMLDKPVIIHCRDAYAETLALLQTFGRFRENPGVMHCFGGDLSTAQQVCALGYTISVGGILTFKNAESLRSLVAQMPRNQLLIETDCPYLAPVPHRGKRNEPAYALLVAEKVSNLWEIPLAETLEQIQRNVTRVFGIPEKEG